MSDFDILFPIPGNRRNADDMGLPSRVKIAGNAPSLDEVAALRDRAALAIGPNKVSEIDAITKDLKLL